MIILWCVCRSCGLDSEARPAGLAGADPAAQAKGGHSEGRDGGAEPAKAFCHHLLWCERRWKVHQPGQGEFSLLDFSHFSLILRLLMKQIYSARLFSCWLSKNEGSLEDKRGSNSVLENKVVSEFYIKHLH